MSDAAIIAPSKPPTLMLFTPPTEAKKEEDIDSMLNAPFVETREIVLVDPCVVKILNALPYKIPKHIEASIMSILQASWAPLPEGDKVKLWHIFELIGGNRQISTRLRNIVNEITKDGRIDMEDLPHIVELIVTLLDIFQDLKLPQKSDHLIVPIFEFLVMIIVASTLASPDELDKWSVTIRAAMTLVQLQVRKASGCSCC